MNYIIIISILIGLILFSKGMMENERYKSLSGFLILLLSRVLYEIFYVGGV